MSKVFNSPPAFSIYRRGQIRPEIRYAFLESRIITNECHSIGSLQSAGYDWNLILDSPAEACILERDGAFSAIISFQYLVSGDRIAICRRLDSFNKTKTMKDSK